MGFVLLFLVLARVLFESGTLLITLIHGEETTANDEYIMDLIVNNNMFILYYILLVVSLIILLPIMEELVFRGIATNLLFKKKLFGYR